MMPRVVTCGASDPKAHPESLLGQYPSAGGAFTIRCFAGALFIFASERSGKWLTLITAYHKNDVSRTIRKPWVVQE